MADKRRSNHGDKPKVASTSSASRSSSTAAPVDDVNPAAGHGDATLPSASSSPGINNGDPSAAASPADRPVKKGKRWGNKRGSGSSRCSGSTGTPADENSAAGRHYAAAGSTTPSAPSPGVPSASPSPGSSSSTGTPVDESSASAAGQHDIAAAAAGSSASSASAASPADRPVKKGKRRGNKRGSGSTGTPADENSAAGRHSAAAGGTTPSAPLQGGVPSASPSPGSSGSTGIPVDENSAAGHHDAAAAAGSSASSASAAINDNPLAARSLKKAGSKRTPRGKKSVTSDTSSPVPANKDDPSVALELAPSPNKPVGGGTHPPTSTTSCMEVEYRYSVVKLKQSTNLHGSGRQLKAADIAASTSSGTVGDHAVFKTGGEAIMVHSGLHKNLPHTIFKGLQLQFLKFLNEYTNQGEQCPFYKAQVLSLSLRKCYILEVNFNHLKSSLFKNTTEYWDLVFKIVNNQDSTQSWLQQVISIFLKSEGFDGDEKTIDSNAKVHFTNKPQSIRMLSDALKDRPEVVRKLGVLHDEVIMNALTAYGRSTFLAVLAELLNRHRKEESYNGKFQIGNIVIVNSELCWILMAPSPKSTRTKMKSDLGQLWTIMEQYYSNEGHLPLYFAELKDDLVNEQLSNVTMEWFRLHLEYHPALMPSTGRRNMIYGLNSVIQDNKSSMDEAFRSFLEKVPFESKDWRDKVKKGQSQIMEIVYTFRPPSLKQDPLAKTGSSQDHFANTWEGLLGYIRNFLMHANKTAKIVDTDEIELFAASKFPTLLPRLLKTVSSNRKIQPYFTGVLSSYRTSRSNPKDLPS